MALFTKMKKVTQAHALAKKAQEDSQRTQVAIEELKKKISLLSLINQSLWTIISEHLELDNDVLAEKVKELEEKFSGNAPPLPCASCGKPIHITKKRCIFCGAVQPGKDLFDALRGN